MTRYWITVRTSGTETHAVDAESEEDALQTFYEHGEGDLIDTETSIEEVASLREAPQ